MFFYKNNFKGTSRQKSTQFQNKLRTISTLEIFARDQIQEHRASPYNSVVD